MRPYGLLVGLVLAFSLFCAADPTLAASDDDIPGNALALGSSVSQSVSSADAKDVYAVTLTAGQEVHIRCDPGTTSGPKGSLPSSITDRRRLGDRLYAQPHPPLGRLGLHPGQIRHLLSVGRVGGGDPQLTPLNHPDGPGATDYGRGQR